VNERENILTKERGEGKILEAEKWEKPKPGFKE